MSDPPNGWKFLCYATRVIRPDTTRLSPAGIRKLVVILLLALSPIIASCQHDPAARDKQLWTYYPWWMRTAWENQGIEGYSRIFFFEYRITPDADLHLPPEGGATWKKLRVETRRRGIPLDKTLTLFDARTFELIFRDRTRRNRLLQQVLAQSTDADGIQLDLEIFQPASRPAVQGFREFVAALGGRLHALPKPKTLSAFLTQGGQTTLFDATTAAHLDFVVVQGYDAVWDGAPNAGPVAPLKGPSPVTWEKGLQRALDLNLKRRQIVMAIPLYGYEWPTVSAQPQAATRGRGRQITFAPVDHELLPWVRVSATQRTAQFGTRRHQETDTPYFVFHLPDGWWQGWFDDERSFARKLTFIRQEGLLGVATFAYGYDRGRLEKSVRQSFGIGRQPSIAAGKKSD